MTSGPQDPNPSEDFDAYVNPYKGRYGANPEDFDTPQPPAAAPGGELQAPAGQLPPVPQPSAPHQGLPSYQGSNANPYGYDPNAGPHSSQPLKPGYAPLMGGGPINHKLGVGEAVSVAWKHVKSRFGLWFVTSLFVGFVSAFVLTTMHYQIQFIIDHVTDESMTSEEFARLFEELQPTGSEQLLALLATIILQVLGALYIMQALRAARGESYSFGTFFSLPNAGNVITYVLVYGVIGYVLALIPGMGPLLQLVFSLFAMFGLLDALHRGSNPLTAFQNSFRLVAANFGIAIVLTLATVGLVLLGALIFIIGAAITVAIASVALAVIYLNVNQEPVALPHRR